MSLHGHSGFAELKEYIFSRVAMNHFKATEANTAYLK